MCEQARKWSTVPWIIDGVLVHVDHLDRHLARAKAAGAIILSDIEEGPPGRQMTVFEVWRAFMSSSGLYAPNVSVRAMLKMLVFMFSLFAAVFSASAGYGLLKMLLRAMSSGAHIGIAEFSTHGGLTIAFFVLAGLGTYAAKKCYW